MQRRLVSEIFSLLRGYKRRRGRRQRGSPLWLALLLLGLLGYGLWETYFRPLPQTYKAPGGLELYFAPQQGREAKARLIRLMDGAQNRLELAVHELEDREIGQALVRAAARGVQVRLFSESNYRREARESLGIRSHNPARCETLQKVQVCYDSREDALMHHKFVLVDDQGVWTGSTNLTWNAFERNNENSLWLPVEGLVTLYRREFEALFGGQESGLGLSGRFQIGTLEGQVYFSPAGGRQGREALLERLRQARREVWVAAFVLTDATVVEALVAAHRRGVRVRVLLESRNLQNSAHAALTQAGLEVRRDGNPYTMHHKVMVLDGEWVVTGSYNFTTSAYRRNNENLLILRDAALAQRYLLEVEAIWKAGVGL
ncbi:phospholipase D-like domain-containing protein [Meiothermus rufus]|uniref:phospholipase D-like domain-containing protein n=1 Tax=Meiothermus rufus TaxID=604332 RepID=UPI000415D50D|nr:phospholipase D-like domain-containing protein [Meiothermus rufus]